MLLVPKRCNDMMDLGRLQGYEVRLKPLAMRFQSDTPKKKKKTHKGEHITHQGSAGDQCSYFGAVIKEKETLFLCVCVCVVMGVFTLGPYTSVRTQDRFSDRLEEGFVFTHRNSL